jgi:hypothetical protein
MLLLLFLFYIQTGVASSMLHAEGGWETVVPQKNRCPNLIVLLSFIGTFISTCFFFVKLALFQQL